MEHRKGLSGGYGYLLLSVVFITLFATGTTIASESIEGISDFTGVTPPSEIRACTQVPKKAYDDNIIFKIGDGYPFVPKDETDFGINFLNNSDNRTLTLQDDDDFGQLRIEKDFEYIQVLENITYGYSNFGGGNISIRVFSEAPGLYKEYQLLKEINITEDEEDVVRTSEAVDNKELEKMRLIVEMERTNNTFQNPMIYYVGLIGEQKDEEVEYVWYKDLGSNLLGLYGKTKQMAYCSIMQIANLFHAVTMTTGEWWMDMVLVPFQIVLLIIIIRVVSEIVGAFPFT